MEWNEKLQRIIDYVEDHLQRRKIMTRFIG